MTFDHQQPTILLFDGVCNLCNGLVQFIIKRDPKRKFRFAALQSESGQVLLKKLGLPSDNFDSLVLIKDEHYFLKSTAILHILIEIGGIWKLLTIFIIVPFPLRDFFYNFIAKTRYKIFGKRDQCMLPTSEIKQRFLT